MNIIIIDLTTKFHKNNSYHKQTRMIAKLEIIPHPVKIICITHAVDTYLLLFIIGTYHGV